MIHIKCQVFFSANDNNNNNKKNRKLSATILLSTLRVKSAIGNPRPAGLHSLEIFQYFHNMTYCISGYRPTILWSSEPHLSCICHSADRNAKQMLHTFMAMFPVFLLLFFFYP